MRSTIVSCQGSFNWSFSARGVCVLTENGALSPAITCPPDGAPLSEVRNAKVSLLGRAVPLRSAMSSSLGSISSSTSPAITDSSRIACSTLPTASSTWTSASPNGPRGDGVQLSLGESHVPNCGVCT